LYSAKHFHFTFSDSLLGAECNENLSEKKKVQVG
jgi:hypothetical protein